jgi:hypothetical protein
MELRRRDGKPIIISKSRIQRGKELGNEEKDEIRSPPTH